MPFLHSLTTVNPKYEHAQTEIYSYLEALLKKANLPLDYEKLKNFFIHSGVEKRFLSLPLSHYGDLGNLKTRNDQYIKTALELVTSATEKLFTSANLPYDGIDAIFSTTITGIATPSIDARLMNKLPLNPKAVRTPIFGLGCLAGVAGINRVYDYLKAYPKRSALFFSVELCSLTMQPDDFSIANMVSLGLFGDGAAAVLLVGDDHPLAKSSAFEICEYNSTFYPNTEGVMGWDVVQNGFKIILSKEVPEVALTKIPKEYEWAKNQISSKYKNELSYVIAHPGGPKVIDALEVVTGRKEDLALSRDSLKRFGNMSSSSVLFILDEFIKQNKIKDYGVMMALGPAFCSEMTIVRKC